jgi:hypothetical protein
MKRIILLSLLIAGLWYLEPAREPIMASDPKPAKPRIWSTSADVSFTTGATGYTCLSMPVASASSSAVYTITTVPPPIGGRSVSFSY